MKIAIIGSGDLAVQITHYIESYLNDEVVGYFDDFVPPGTIKNKKNILGSTNLINDLYSNHEFDSLVIAIGYNNLKFRSSIFNKFKGLIPFYNIIHPNSQIDCSSSLGEGVIVLSGTIIGLNTQIGDNVILYPGCIVSHDTTIGNHCFLSPAVKIAGFCDIGDSCNLGINTTIIDNISIISGVVTGGGTVVISNILEEGTYVGVPHKKANK